MYICVFNDCIYRMDFAAFVREVTRMCAISDTAVHFSTDSSHMFFGVVEWILYLFFCQHTDLTPTRPVSPTSHIWHPFFIRESPHFYTIIYIMCYSSDNVKLGCCFLRVVAFLNMFLMWCLVIGYGTRRPFTRGNIRVPFL